MLCSVGERRTEREKSLLYNSAVGYLETIWVRNLYVSHGIAEEWHYQLVGVSRIESVVGSGENFVCMEDEGKQKLLRTSPFFFVRVLLTCHLSENRKDKSQSVKLYPI
jgi:hypothetical protein